MENVTMPHLIVRPDWLALNDEAPLEPERRIIDPHHHLWERPSARYLFHDLHADVTCGHNVEATVYIQCRSM
ncbi:MAG: amidohydrolase, partial [Pseudomonadota bacterium]